MNDYPFKIRWCPICNQGWVEIVKDKKTNQLFLCCTECETEWTNPEAVHENNGTHDNFGQTIKPLLEEIKELDWDKYLKNNFEKEIIDLVKKVNNLPEQDKKNITELAQANEWGIAFDTLCSQIYEYDVTISNEIYEKIAKLGNAMNMEDSLWLILKKLVKQKQAHG